MEKFEEYFRTTERYQDFLCWGSDKWIFKSIEGRYLSEEIQRLYEVWQHQQAKVEELQALYTQQGINMLKLQKRVDAALKLIESWNEIAFDKTTHWTEGYEEGCYHCAAQLEQALKGEG